MEKPFAQINGISQQLSPIQSMTQGLGGMKEASGDEAGAPSFGNVLANQLKGVNDSLNFSADMTDKLIKGEVKNPHDVAISGEKAGIMLKLTTTVCTKVASACTTLFQMQI